MESNPLQRPTWQLPPGVSRGAWEYANTEAIATEYDAFHRGHPLLEFDQRIILETAKRLEDLQLESTSDHPQPKVVIDLGCGTGRSLLPLAERGWRTIGVDLSRAMLAELRSRASSPPWLNASAAIRGNIVHLEFMKESTVDLILCMYSSIGMIRGRAHRRAIIGHARRMLKGNGRLILHAHNRGGWIRDPRGLRLTFEGWWRSKRDRDWELGDRIYAYRGLPNMFLHIYSRNELIADLLSQGLAIESLILLNRHSSGELRFPWLLPHLRAGGFLVTAHRNER